VEVLIDGRTVRVSGNVYTGPIRQPVGVWIVRFPITAIEVQIGGVSTDVENQQSEERQQSKFLMFPPGKVGCLAE
jgi:hypothetical protein